MVSIELRPKERLRRPVRSPQIPFAARQQGTHRPPTTIRLYASTGFSLAVCAVQLFRGKYFQNGLCFCRCTDYLAMQMNVPTFPTAGFNQAAPPPPPRVPSPRSCWGPKSTKHTQCLVCAKFTNSKQNSQTQGFSSTFI